MSYHVWKVLHVHVNYLNITFLHATCRSRTAIDDAKFSPVRHTEIMIIVNYYYYYYYYYDWSSGSAMWRHRLD